MHFRRLGHIGFFQSLLNSAIPRGGGYFTINSYGGVRRKDFCYDPIPEIWSDIDTQSQNICQILIPNRRSNKSNLTSKGLGIEGWERLFWFQVAIGTRF